MLKFLKYMINHYDNYKNTQAQYDEDGNYVDPRIGKLSTEELIIPADKARILHSKSAEDVKMKERKKIFQMIHREIKNGKTHMKLEMYMAKPAMMEYLVSLGYTIETITPPAASRGSFVPTLFDDDDNEVESDGIYRYYKVSWAPDAVVETAEINVITTAIQA